MEHYGTGTGIGSGTSILQVVESSRVKLLPSYC